MNAAVQARGEKSKPTGILGTLKLSAVIQPKKTQADQRTPRQVLADFLQQQIAVVDGDIAGKEVTFPKSRFVRNTDGSSTKKTVDVRVRKSYWRDSSSGKWFLQLRYGNQIVMINSFPSIEAGSSLEAVRNTFVAVQKALDNAELDEALSAAAAAAKRKFVPKERH